MHIGSQPGSRFAQERVTVFGGLGFIGSHLCRKLVNEGHFIRIFDRSGESHDLVKDFEHATEILEGDIARLEDVDSALADATILINLIHTTVPGSSMRDPAYDVISNVANSARWLERIGGSSLRKVIYFSSGGTVYGVPQKLPIAEEHPTDPLSSYGITKLAIEKYTAMYADRFGINYCVVRPSNVYGPGQRLHYGQGVIGILASRALRGEALEVWGEGTDRRDYLYIEDLVDAIHRLFSYGGRCRVFNISSGTGHSVLDVIDVLRKQIKPLPQVSHLPPRGFDVPVNILDSTRLLQEIGWRPAIEFEEGISRTIEWLKRLKPET